MADDHVLVTGATGATGSHTVSLLLDRGVHVRAFVHSDDDRAGALRDRGVDVHVGDLLDLAAVGAALADMDTAYFVYPIEPRLVEASAYFAQAARDTGLRAVVNMSQISARRDATSNAARQHWISERIFDWSIVPCTHLRPTFFAENLLRLTAGDVAAHGVIRLPMGDGRYAPVTARDQAHVIAAILQDPHPHTGQTYPLYGPVEMNYDEIAQVFATVLDRPVHYEPIEYDVLAEMLTAVGIGPHLVQHLRHVSQDFQRGVFAGTNDVVERIGQTTPTTVAAFVDQHRTQFTP